MKNKFLLYLIFIVSIIITTDVFSSQSSIDCTNLLNWPEDEWPYVIDTDQNGTITINVTEISEGCDFDLYLWDEDEKVDWSEHSGNQNESISYSAEANKLFYIIVERKQGDGMFRIKATWPGPQLEMPDLEVVNDVEIVGETYVNNPVNISARIKNNGNSDVHVDVLTYLYHNRTAPPTYNDDDYNDSYNSYCYLGVGDENELYFWDFTSSEVGTWDMYLLVDGALQEDELNDANNVYGPITINWTPEPPDLAIDDIYIDPAYPNPIAGDIAKVYVVIRNDGASVTTPFKVALFNNRTDVPYPGYAYDSLKTVESLDKDDKKTLTFTVTSEQAASWKTWALVDWENVIPDEKDEDNNAWFCYINWLLRVYGNIRFTDVFKSEVRPVWYTNVKIVDGDNPENVLYDYEISTDIDGNFGKDYRIGIQNNVDNVAIKLESEIWIGTDYVTSVFTDGAQSHASPIINELDEDKKGNFDGVHLEYDDDDSEEEKIFFESLQIAMMICDEWQWVYDYGSFYKREYLPVYYNYQENTNPSYYDHDLDLLVITRKGNNQYWRAPLHEYAHAIMGASYGGIEYGTKISPHYHYTVAQDTLFPWVEGWAEFMECAVPNKTYFSEYGEINIENNDWGYGDVKGEKVEGAVASVLWDIWDAPYDELDETHGSMDEQFSRIFNILKNNKPKTLPEFLTAWGNDNKYQMEGVARGHHISGGWIDIPADPSMSLPTHYSVSANYPNPFNPSTTIRYQMPVPGLVKIRVFNMLGQYVTTLINESKPSGWHNVLWNGDDKQGNQVATGTYIIWFELKNYKKAISITLLK
ncbi:T9SS type A sorting domain-containing protein [candidate division KSB1 bacterium]|nr:T9SS type A sorting domain-containing protein [candidate division KSB1 bacterium]